MTAQWKSDEPTIPTGACSGSYGSQRNVNLAVNGTENFDYTGNVVCAYLQKTGYYKLEVWGAEGGTGQSHSGGYGGYSYGKIHAESGSTVYVVVGGKGTTGNGSKDTLQGGGYNGGGNGYYTGTCYHSGGGGGATHIATITGILSSLSSTTNQAKVLIVAGGGGGDGACGYNNGPYSNGGGMEGSYISVVYSSYSGTNTNAGGKQTTGGTAVAFGAGTTYTGNNGSFGLGGHSITNGNYGTGGGGGGWYGGASGSSSSSSYGGSPGGGGSGYIGNALLLSDKGMHMHSNGCTSSTATATKTTCTSSTGAHVANAANTGNGYAKITYLGT